LSISSVGVGVLPQLSARGRTERSENARLSPVAGYQARHSGFAGKSSKSLAGMVTVVYLPGTTETNRLPLLALLC
jgi:hypothetical protein